uniref:Phosphodiesterase n=1 Tax=Serinus canaria TaxID=9135 RepID=A0A8C9N9V8_SERCA
MESPTKEIEEFENNSLKYLQSELWSLVKQMERGEVSIVDLKKNLEYATTVLESVYIDETRRLLDTEDELSDIQSDSVPSEVRDWLASTFTRQMGMMLKRTEEKPRFRSIVHAVQAGIFVQNLFLAFLLISFVPLLNSFHWLTELEIFAVIFAAAIHDYEHTGTTNNFHIQTREFRALVIQMVLATNMSCHFQQIKAMKNALQQIDKPKALSLLLHTADISHPAKAWDLHHRWTMSLLEEFFRQGNKEAELGLPFSPLCDRTSTMVAQSQIGFIDFIVEPTFTVLTDMTEKIVTPLIDEASLSGMPGFRRSSLNSIRTSEVKRSSVKSTGSEGSASLNCSILTVDFKSQATKEEKAKREAEENAYQGTDEKERDEQDGKPGEDVTEAKTKKSKEPNPGESKKTESSKNPVNGTWQSGMSKHEAYQRKNTARTDKKMDLHHTVGEEKQHVQNGEFSSSTET